MVTNNNLILLDTNIWVYFYAQDDPIKYNLITEIIDKNFSNILISTQVLGELYYVLTRKKIFDKQESQEIINELTNHFYVSYINTVKVLKAIEINSKFQYSYWDSLIISTAISDN